MLYFRLVLLAFVILSYGCNALEVKKLDKPKIGNIYIDHVKNRFGPFYSDGTSIAVSGAIGGVIGMSVAGAAMSKPEKVKRIVDESKIELDSYIAVNLAKELRKLNIVRSTSNKKDDFEIFITISEYGFYSGVFESGCAPYLVVNTEIRDNKNKLGKSPGFQFESKQVQPLEDWAKEKNKAKLEFESLADQVIASIAYELTQDKGFTDEEYY